MSITYADVPLLILDRQHVFQRWLDDNLPLLDRHFFCDRDAWFREGRERSRGTRVSRSNGSTVPNVTLPVPNYSCHLPPRWKINSLWWPTGAARHSVGLFLASDAELAQILANLSRDNRKYANLVIDEGTSDESGTWSRLTCQKMYLLPPLRLTSVGLPGESPLASPSIPPNRVFGDNQAPTATWLLCLVDQRYFWPFATTGNFAISDGDTWEDLYDTLASRLNTTITYDDVPYAYGRPEPTEIGRLYEDPAMMLDAITHSVGQRIVCGYDGSIGAVNYLTSNDIFIENARQFAPIAAGGMPADWRSAAYPESVRVVFPVRNFYQLTIDRLRNVDIRYDQVFSDGQTTGTGSFKTIYSTALADFSGAASSETSEYESSDPENLSDLEDLAEIIADDYYGYISAPYDVNFPGVFRWIPEGFNDWVWYHAGSQRSEARDGNGDYEYYTRAVSHPINFGTTSQLSQVLDPVKVLELRPCEGESPALFAWDTRDYAAGELLGEKVGKVARVFGKCFEIHAVSEAYADAIRVPVISIQDTCEGCETSSIVVIGQATTSVSSGTATFNIDNITSIEGQDPRVDPGSATETLAVKNSLHLGLDNDAWVFAIKNKDGGFETWADTLGGGGGPGNTVDIVHFAIAPGQELEVGDSSCTATVISSTDGTTGTITLTNVNGRFTGLAGYEGFAYKVTIAGSPVYHIFSMEGPARFADFVADDDSAPGDSIVVGNIAKYWGNPPNGVNSGTDPQTIHKLSDEKIRIVQGERFRAIWDEKEKRWELFWHAGLRITIKGTVGTVSRDDANFALSDVALVSGLRFPTGATITVLNDPKIKATNGSTVFAEYDDSLFPGIHWRVQGFNWDHIARGHDGYATNDKLLGVVDGEIKWVDEPTGGGGGGGGAPSDIKVVLIDADIEGITEATPQDFLTASEVTVPGGWTAKFQDPPDADLTANWVSDNKLNLHRYRRVKLRLKVYEGKAETGTAQTGSTITTIKLAASANVTNDFYNGDTVEITSGLGSGQSRTISDYAGSTKVATVDSAWATTPDDTSVYAITSSANTALATETVDDDANSRRIVRYAYIDVWYDDGKSFLVGEYTRSDYPDYDENAAFPPSGLAPGFLNRRFRGLVIGGVLVTILCKPLPPPELP